MAINGTNDGITIACAGLYNVQYSLEFESSVASLQTIEIWFARNNVAIPRSNTEFHTKGAGEKQVAVTNFIYSASAGDDFQVYWASSDSTMQLTALTSNYGGPAIPSAIVTVTPVGA